VGRKHLLVVAGLWLTATVAPAAAPREAPHANTIVLFNDTSMVLLYLYARAEGSADWEEDLLGNLVVEPGKSIKVNLDIGPNRCRFDIRVEFIDDSKQYFPRFDACRETVLHVPNPAPPTRS
jgi:hypothetical protein